MNDILLLARKPMPSKDYLLQCLSYEADSGKFSWKARPVEHFKTSKRADYWNRRYSGVQAFSSKQTDGYLRGKLDGQPILAHRLAWKIMTGEDPDVIAHLDGNPSNNRFSNLRDGTTRDNLRGARRLASCSKSGIVGVYKATGRSWQAQIRSTMGATLSFTSTSLAEAAAWRKQMEMELGYEPRKVVGHE